jgi:general secretion pathway protein J
LGCSSSGYNGAKTGSNKSNTGFSLVEAIVALVVLSFVFTAVWGWFGTALTSTARIEQALSLPEVFTQSMVNIELEPLQERLYGENQVGTYLVRWSATPERSSNKEHYRRQPAWIVTLFKVQAQIIHNDREVSSFTTKVVRQWPDPEYIDFSE